MVAFCLPDCSSLCLVCFLRKVSTPLCWSSYLHIVSKKTLLEVHWQIPLIQTLCPKVNTWLQTGSGMRWESHMGCEVWVWRITFLASLMRIFASCIKYTECHESHHLLLQQALAIMHQQNVPIYGPFQWKWKINCAY